MFGALAIVLDSEAPVNSRISIAALGFKHYQIIPGLIIQQLRVVKLLELEMGLLNSLPMWNGVNG